MAGRKDVCVTRPRNWGFNRSRVALFMYNLKLEAGSALADRPNLMSQDLAKDLLIAFLGGIAVVSLIVAFVSFHRMNDR
jgi:hypothetical protein